MKSTTLDNGMKLIYEKRNSNLSSICLALEAGAVMEDSIYGVAHAVEHLVYKGTITRTEDDINEKLDNIFAFQNAMTNYPYVIYYGSLLSEDIEEGIELFADILINPTFTEEAFCEEMKVVVQELQEWDSDLEQYCEDKLFLNAINNRLKYPIIGKKTTIHNIKNKDVIEFYNKLYNPENAVISVVTDRDEEDVIDIVNRHFSIWSKKENTNKKENPKEIKLGIYTDVKHGSNTSRVEIISDISNLSVEELGILYIFNEYYGKGVNSYIFNELRTKRSLVYDVLTSINYEKHIGLYKIFFNTEEKNIDEAIEVIRNIDRINYNSIDINKMMKQYKLKKLFKEDQGIVLAKELAINSILGKEYIIPQDITIDDIKNVVSKVFGNIAIQIIKGE